MDFLKKINLGLRSELWGNKKSKKKKNLKKVHKTEQQQQKNLHADKTSEKSDSQIRGKQFFFFSFPTFSFYFLICFRLKNWKFYFQLTTDHIWIWGAGGEKCDALGHTRKTEGYASVIAPR